MANHLKMAKRHENDMSPLLSKERNEPYMNSPYNGRFRVSQTFKGKAHQGMDLVGLDSKEIHSTVNGTIEIAGYNDPFGFGRYVRIRQDGTGYHYYYGHMSQTLVKVGDQVQIGTLIGIEGSTGNSTGSHCHYEMRQTLAKSSFGNISEISSIPNRLGIYDDKYDDESQRTGWVKANGKWFYYENGQPVKGWKKVDGKWYYMDPEGIMQTGWVKVGEKWYYLDASGAMITGWRKIDNRWYYFDGSGAMQKGWIKYKEKWYFLSGSGAMVTGLRVVNDKAYYFQSDGAMIANKNVTLRADASGALH